MTVAVRSRTGASIRGEDIECFKHGQFTNIRSNSTSERGNKTAKETVIDMLRRCLCLGVLPMIEVTVSGIGQEREPVIRS